MRILSLDQALKVSGIAVFENGKLLHKDTFSTKGSAPIEQRLGAIWEKLSDLYHEWSFDYLILEDCQQQKNAQTYQKLSMVKAAIILWCYFNDTKYSVYAPSHWRSLLNIKGRARAEQKENAIAFVQEKYKIEATSDEADAICIGAAYYESLKTNNNSFVV